MEVKKCSKRQRVKPLDSFDRAAKSKDGYQWHCKACRKLYNGERYKYDLEANRSKNLKRLYGITSEEYQAMFTARNGVCAACGQPETSVDSRTKQMKNLQIDHCHTTGKLRALLCKECNNALGLLHDDLERIRLLLKYAELHQSTHTERQEGVE